MFLFYGGSSLALQTHAPPPSTRRLQRLKSTDQHACNVDFTIYLWAGKVDSNHFPRLYHCRNVIFATNAYTAGLLPEYATKIVPSKGICCRIVIPPSSAYPPLTNTHVLRLPNGGFDYLVPRKDGSIILGGARTTFFNDHKNWYNNTDDSTLIASAASYFDNYMQIHFHGWEDSEAQVDQIWTGILGYTSDEPPALERFLDGKGVLSRRGLRAMGCRLFGWL